MSKGKKIAIISLVFTIIGVIIGVVAWQFPKEPKSKLLNNNETETYTSELFVENIGAVNERGNTNGNIMNWGYATIQGDWIYYNGENDYLYKINVNDSGITQLNETSCYFINVVGEWVYYSNEDGLLFKIKIDGTEETQILGSDYGAMGIIVLGDWIYFVDVLDADNNNNYIYKTKTDGSNTSLVVEFTGHKMLFCVEGNWVYYIDEETTLCKIQTDATNKTQLINGYNFATFVVCDDWIYFIALNEKPDFVVPSQEGEMFKIRVNGTNKTKIIESRSTLLNISDNWIYYNNFEGNSDGDFDRTSEHIYKIRFDGSEKTKITTENYDVSDEFDYYFITGINIVGNWIFYSVAQLGIFDKKYYKVRTDGTDNQIVS